MNISEKTVLTGIEKTGCSVGHIQHCLHAAKKHGNPLYSYFGTVVQRGKIDLYTKNGTFTAAFSCRNGWLEELKF